MIHATYHASSYQASFTNGLHEAVADLPTSKGGEGQGFGPHELLEAALATCMTITVKLCARKTDIDLQSVSCVVQLDRSTPDEVKATYQLTLEGTITQEQASMLCDAASKCPVAKTLAKAIAIHPLSSQEC